MSEELTLAEKIAAANRDIGPIKQGGSNTHQNYTFQTEADIKAAVQRVTSKYGFAIIPSFQVTKQYERQTRRGGVMSFYDVLGTFTITDGKDKLIGTMPGTGSDSGDKAVQKACTSAQKYFYKQLFNISDREDDPDTTDSNPGGGYVKRTPRAAAKTQQTRQSAANSKKYTKQEMLTAQVEYGKKKVNLFTVYDAAKKKDSAAIQWWNYWYERPETKQGNLIRQYTEFAKKQASTPVSKLVGGEHK